MRTEAVIEQEQDGGFGRLQVGEANQPCTDGCNSILESVVGELRGVSTVVGFSQ